MERIRQLRKERGLSQVKLAVMADMDPATLNRLERGTGNPNLKTMERVADALGVEVADLLPKAPRRSPSEPTLNDALGEERRLGYLRAWRAFVYKLIQRWEETPPKTAAEVGVVSDTMQALLNEGAFQRPPETLTTRNSREASEWLDLSFLFRGIDRLNKIADAVQEDAEAERRRATFREIEGRMAG